MLIKQGKTNVKYLFIITVLAIFVGGLMVGAIKITECSYSRSNTDPQDWYKTIDEKEEKLPEFKDFPILENFEGDPAPVDFSSHPSAETFFTRISEGAKKEPNFAGHYTIIEWGCGTGCQAGVVFDAETGSVYNLPGSETGRDYRVDSNLLIVNPINNVLEVYGRIKISEFPEWISTRYFKWENNQFELIQETKDYF